MTNLFQNWRSRRGQARRLRVLGECDACRHSHRQVTDAYLASLAAAHGGRLATFDQALSALRPTVTLAIP